MHLSEEFLSEPLAEHSITSNGKILDLEQILLIGPDAAAHCVVLMWHHGAAVEHQQCVLVTIRMSQSENSLWCHSPLVQRRIQLLIILLQYLVSHQSGSCLS